MENQEQIEEIAKLICRMPKKCDDFWQYQYQAKDFTICAVLKEIDTVPSIITMGYKGEKKLQEEKK